MYKITKFYWKYYFLSNYYPCKIWVDGKMYTSVEHAFQAAKTIIPAERDRVRRAAYPGQARLIGETVTLRENWDELKLDLMRALLMEKFTDQELRGRLLATRTALLIHGNTWGDTYWGICAGRGSNWLGKLLMEVRNYYRKPRLHLE